MNFLKQPLRYLGRLVDRFLDPLTEPKGSEYVIY